MSEKNDFITVVSGLPRSGTSMMMKILESGGLEVYQDGIREADIDNPKGYYEYEKVKKLKENSDWLENVKGKAIKIIFNFLYNLPADLKFKIIFMKRDLDEVINSQNKMIKRRGEVSKISNEQLKGLYLEEIAKIEKWLSSKPNMNVLYIKYSNVVENPDAEVLKINSFLDNCLNASGMKNAIDNSLYRNKKE